METSAGGGSVFLAAHPEGNRSRACHPFAPRDQCVSSQAAVIDDFIQRDFGNGSVCDAFRRRGNSVAIAPCARSPNRSQFWASAERAARNSRAVDEGALHLSGANAAECQQRHARGFRIRRHVVTPGAGRAMIPSAFGAHVREQEIRVPWWRAPQ